MGELPQIEREIDLPVAPEEVWRRVVDGDLAEEWMRVRLDPRPGGDVVVPDKDMIGTVEEIVPGKSITWSWRELEGEASQVTIGLEPTGKGTRVRVTERLLEYRITGAPPVYLNQAA